MGEVFDNIMLLRIPAKVPKHFNKESHRRKKGGFVKAYKKAPFVFDSKVAKKPFGFEHANIKKERLKKPPPFAYSICELVYDFLNIFTIQNRKRREPMRSEPKKMAHRRECAINEQNSSESDYHHFNEFTIFIPRTFFVQESQYV